MECFPCMPAPVDDAPDELKFFGWNPDTGEPYCFGCKKPVTWKNVYWHCLYQTHPPTLQQTFMVCGLRCHVLQYTHVVSDVRYEP